MKVLKKIIITSISILIINLNYFNIFATNIFKDDITSAESSPETTYTNISLTDNVFVNEKCFTVTDLTNGVGECIYQKQGVEKITVCFYHRLSTVAHKTTISGEKFYVLGMSENYNVNECKVKYLPKDDCFGGLADSLYIKNKGWHRLIIQNDNYKFIPLDDDLNKELTLHKKSLVDYGVNIYVSADGQTYKRLKPTLTIKKLDPITVGESEPLFGTDGFYEKLTLKNIPKSTKYIKIQINEFIDPPSGTPSPLIGLTIGNLDDYSPENMAFISKIKFNLSSTEINATEKEPPLIKNRTLPLGLSSVKSTSSTTDDDLHKKIKKMSRKFKKIKNKPNKKSAFKKLKDNPKDTKEKTESNFKNGHKKTNSKKLTDDEFVTPDSIEDDFIDFQTSSIPKHHKQNRYHKQKNQPLVPKTLGDEISLEPSKESTTSSVVPTQPSNADVEKEEVETQQAKSEKTAGTIYLSSLLVTLGSFFTYNKLGFVRKLFRL